jgi:hypothetical protein
MGFQREVVGTSMKKTTGRSNIKDVENMDLKAKIDCLDGKLLKKVGHLKKHNTENRICM